MPIRVINRPGLPLRPDKALARNPALDYRGDALGAPVSFTAEIDSLAAGEVANLDTTTLQPGFRTPYWIDEIRIAATYNVPVLASYVDYLPWTGLGSYIGLKFQTGHYSFSRDFVPMGLHAPRWSRADSGVTPGGTYTFGGVGTTYQRAFSYVRWPLPKPLFMPAGDAVQCSVRVYPYTMLNLFGTSSLIEKVSVTYVGRLAAPGTPPAPVRHVPWLAWFQKQFAENGYAQTNDQFRNPFSDKMLYVQRFTMRQVIERTGGVGVNYSMYDATGVRGQPNGASATFAYDEARLYDSLGYAIIPDYVPVDDAFDSTRGAWTFGRTLGPREQFDLQLRSKGSLTDASAPYWTQIGMVGFREENV